MSTANESGTASSRALIILLAVFASGAAGLAFEVLWFRQLTWVVGGTVWAATAVLAAFMAGLCLGYWLSTRLKLAPASALRVYVVLELLIAVTGMALVVGLPMLPHVLAGLLPFAEMNPGAAQVLRFSLAFLLMAVPTTAMGMTLPLLVSALTDRHERTASWVGWLYGINTLGAGLAVLATEFMLIPTLGIGRAGAVAGLANLSAALLVFMVIASWASKQGTPASSPLAERHAAPVITLLLAGVAGAAMLGFEVLGFRLLLLHLRGSAEVFAIMLGTVLVGIAVGGALVGHLGKRMSHPLGIALLAVLIALSLVLAPWWLPTRGDNALLLAVLLFLPASLLSGMLLPAIAGLIARQGLSPREAAGQAFLANTGGAALGVVLAGLILLPGFGVVRSLVLSAGVLVGVAVVLAMLHGMRLRAAAAFIVMLAGSGLAWQQAPALWRTHADAPAAPFVEGQSVTRVHMLEGVNETAQLLRRDFLGEPIAWRLLTNSHSMSNTERDSRRYMKMYVWLPMLLSGGVADALLISYGTGATARALTDDPEPRHIDIVDPSRAVLAFSETVHGEADPLADSRVRIHLEDGRNYLLSTDRRYDLITGEPPPPRLAGIVNLYSAEYFALMHGRLKPGGWASYWLPVDQLSQASSKAIVAAFCASFTDCSLWAGSNYNWMLVGSRGSTASINPERIARLWRGPQSLELAALGLEHPALLGGAFLGDAADLKAWVDDEPMLIDDRPGRLWPEAAGAADLSAYLALSDPARSHAAFRDSVWIQTIWPAGLRGSSLAAFDIQPILNNEINVKARPWLAAALADRILAQDKYRVPVLWLLDSGVDEVNIALRSDQPDAVYHQALRALVSGQPEAALASLRAGGERPEWAPAAVLAACRAGQSQLARQWFVAAGGVEHEQQFSLRCW